MHIPNWVTVGNQPILVKEYRFSMQTGFFHANRVNPNDNQQ